MIGRSCFGDPFLIRSFRYFATFLIRPFPFRAGRFHFLHHRVERPPEVFPHARVLKSDMVGQLGIYGHVDETAKVLSRWLGGAEFRDLLRCGLVIFD
jgi:hypothetical protein